jgi:hypothetical protein
MSTPACDSSAPISILPLTNLSLFPVYFSPVCARLIVIENLLLLILCCLLGFTVALIFSRKLNRERHSRSSGSPSHFDAPLASRVATTPLVHLPCLNRPSPFDEFHPKRAPR